MIETVVATNRKAFHEYHILDRFEAGIELTGSEVKSIREGRVNLKNGFILVREGEVFLVEVHISPYSHTGYAGHEPLRERKLLLNKREIRKLRQQLAEKGLTAVPLKMYFKGGWAKVELGVAKGKKHYDKRDTIKARDLKREIDRDLKHKP